MPAPKQHSGRTRDLAPLTVRVSREERQRIERAAREARLSVSEYVRRRALAD